MENLTIQDWTLLLLAFNQAVNTFTLICLVRTVWTWSTQHRLTTSVDVRAGSAHG